MEPVSPQTASAAEAVRIGHLLDDFLAPQRRGETVEEASLLAAHPDLADELRPHLAMLRTLRAARTPESELAAAGLLPRGADRADAGRLGPYRVDGVLGRGGMGLVLKAHDEQLRRPVALKVLRPELADDSAALARFEREAWTAAALQHPNIATVYAVGRERGMPYIAMEYVDGPSLADLIRARCASNPATATDRATVTSSFGSAVASTLPAGVIRRVLRKLLLVSIFSSGLPNRSAISATGTSSTNRQRTTARCSSESRARAVSTAATASCRENARLGDVPVSWTRCTRSVHVVPRSHGPGRPTSRRMSRFFRRQPRLASRSSRSAMHSSHL